MWLRILLTGLAMELVYGMYISFVRWYEPTMLTSVAALGLLMAIGGYLVGRKAKSNHVAQGALVGLTGVVFYVVVLNTIAQAEAVVFGLQYWLEHCAKVSGGAIGGYIALRQVGSCAFLPGIDMVVTFEDGQLFTKLPIFAEFETSFFAKAVNAQIEFTKDDSTP